MAFRRFFKQRKGVLGGVIATFLEPGNKARLEPSPYEGLFFGGVFFDMLPSIQVVE